MSMKQKVPSVFLAAVCTLAVGTNAAQAADRETKIHYKKLFTIEDETERTLKDAEQQAYDMHAHAVTIEAGTRVDTMDRDFFVVELEAVKDDVNRIGKEIARLEALSAYENSAERSAVERAKPRLKKVAATTEAEISYLRDRPGQLDFPTHRALAASLYEQTDTLWKGLHDSVALADIAKREQRLQRDLKAMPEGE